MQADDNRHIYNRNAEFEELLEYFNNPGCGLVFLRGRRRVGKSWVLLKLKAHFGEAGMLLFTGKEDQKETLSLEEFAKIFDNYIDKITQKHSLKKRLISTKLVELSASVRNWGRYFEVIAEAATALKKYNEVIKIALDEIQWIAKEGSGFIGFLKEKWQLLKDTEAVKFVLCGSSNKFFLSKTGGEEQILRGIATRSDIWINPLTFTDTWKCFFPQWNIFEAACVQMFFGGIPYYLELVSQEKGFILEINKACFVKESIFLQEVGELLRLEFNTRGRETAKHILKYIPENGCSLDALIKKSQLPRSTVVETVDKLQLYSLLNISFYKTPKTRGEPAKYIKIADALLNLYAQVLSKYEEQIKYNLHKNIFGQKIIDSKSWFFIRGFTDGAFERLIFNSLSPEFFLRPKLPNIFKILNLFEPGYKVLSTSEINGEGDIVVLDEHARIKYVIECKWGVENEEWISDLQLKQIQNLDNWNVKKLIAVGYNVSKAFMEKAKKSKIKIIRLEDLIIR